MHDRPSFNLWDTPWIAVETHDGKLERLSIEQLLLQAHEYLALYEQSPVFLAGAWRLLAAILQDALRPRTPADLSALWESHKFPAASIADFGAQFAARFELFAAQSPFMQDGRIPLWPSASALQSRLSSVAYLAVEVASGSNHLWFSNLGSRPLFCPPCAAHGLAAIPAFATAGGVGYRGAVNGAPPLYVFPVGRNLFESLAAALVLPDRQPQAATGGENGAWWRREEPEFGDDPQTRVSYLHGLTFPARRVRLHPEAGGRCDRCGRRSEYSIAEIDYGPGEFYKGEQWLDPFVNYRRSKSKEGALTPVRLWAGRITQEKYLAALWPDNIERPAQALQQAHDLVFQIERVRLLGACTDKATFMEWADVEIPNPFVP